MPTKTQDDKQNFNLFEQSPSLHFQFILAEFISTHKEVQDIENTYKKMETLLIQQRLLANVDHMLDQLLHSITNLTGSTIIQEHCFSWDAQKGSLSKLRHYCYPFVNRFDSQEKTVINLNVCVSKAFHSALQAREIILHLQQENQSTKKTPDYTVLYQLLDKLIDSINRTSRLILQVIFLFREDENVIYFLLRNKDLLNNIYKTTFIEKLFRKMYPKGIEEAGQMLTKKYSKRGFHNLLNAIARKISNLEPNS